MMRKRRGSHTMLRMLWVISLLMAVMTVSQAEESELHKPFVLASMQALSDENPFEAIVKSTKDSLTKSGFEIVGDYTPYPQTQVIAISNDALKEHASQSEKGGFGAVQRVSITTVQDKVQIAYTNPTYMAHVYRMQGDLSAVTAQLKQALGAQQAFGAKGLTEAKLRKYHYKIMMPYFDDPFELAEFASYDEAVAAVENGLAANKGGTQKVYRVDVPGKSESVFGVALSNNCSGDEFIMNKIDFADVKSTPHLPYELMVEGNRVLALHAKFRIAQSFPDLSMVGSNSFFSIMCAPGEIEDALASVIQTEASKAQPATSPEE